MSEQRGFSFLSSFIFRNVVFRVVIFGVLGLFGYSQVAKTEQDNSTRNTLGEVVESGVVGVQVLKVGDCVQMPPEWDETQNGETIGVEAMTAVPCTELHDAELYSMQTLTLSDYPGEDALLGNLSDFCISDYVAYSGVEYDNANPHSIVPVIPTAEGWDAGDKTIQCFAEMKNGGKLGASIRD